MTRRIFCKVLLVVVAIFGVMVLSGILSAQGNRDWAFDRVRDVQERNSDRLMAMDGVEGTAIGYNQNDRLAIKVFTAGPGVRGIPQELDGVPVQVVVTGKFYALSTTDRLDRPVPIGVSTGHPDITAGTIGCRVTDGTNVYALSNNHVYANSNNAEIDDAVIQPGTVDGGLSPADDIGTLFDFVEIDFDGTTDNTIDAAIAISDTGLLGNATPSDGYGIPSLNTVEASLNQPVQKYGRTTGLTKGKVSEVSGIVNVSYGDVDGDGVNDVARFVNQIVILPDRGWFSKGGDSGSLIVTNDNNKNPIGLLFAGGGRRTIANPIGDVLSAFSVTIDSDDTPAPPPNVPPTVSITSPVDGSIFGSGASISFAGTAIDTEDGDLTASLVWTSDVDGEIGTEGSFSATLSDGTHTITASVTDSGGKTGTDSISITVGTPPSGDINVESILFTSKVAGPNKFLYTTVKVVDADGVPLDGVRVEMTLTHASVGSWNFAGDTGNDGTVKFTLGKAPSGVYTATVTNDLLGVASASCELLDDGTVDPVEPSAAR